MPNTAISSPTTTGTDFPSMNVAPPPASVPRTPAEDRVGAVLQQWALGRTVADHEILQHASDCRWLMERAYDRFISSGRKEDREEAIQWMRRGQEAMRSLSPAWKAAREAQVMVDIDSGVGYFAAQAEMDRARMAGGTLG
jgi:hypothetical protein